MKSLVRWTIKNSPAMNTLMVGIILVGSISAYLMHREVFPEFELEIVLITVPYPGASPEEVEEGICQKIEEAVTSIAGIKNLNSVSREGAGTVILELESNVPDVQRILNEVRSEIDRIPSFPDLAEDAEVTQITLRNPAIRVGVLGPPGDGAEEELELREVVERVRRDLLSLPSISQAQIIGGKDYQIDVEIPEATLRKHGKTLRDVAMAIRRENIELPGGKMKTDSQEVLLRGKNKRDVGEEIAKIPVVTDPSGVVLSVDDLGVVRDEFADATAINLINQQPGLAISVDKSSTEDLLKIVKEVKAYVAYHQLIEQGADTAEIAKAKKTLEKITGQTAEPLPDDYRLLTWADRSTMVRDRMNLLTKNGMQGLILVFVVLALFLERRLAFWVAMGIPISMCGALAILFVTGQTLNMLSMFAFLMVLGILVDDAIVVGENVYAHRQMGKGFVQAAIDGTYEVLPSVCASVTTTIIAFSPLLFVPGIMGKFIAVMPFAVIIMLIFSLIESATILPCHLAHSGEKADEKGEETLPRRIQRWSMRPALIIPWLLVFSAVIAVFYLLSPRLAAMAPGVFTPPAVLAITVSLVVAAAFPFLLFPLNRLGDLLTWVNGKVSERLKWVIQRVYTPVLRFALHNPMTVVSTAVSILILAGGMVRAGIVPFNFFPKLDGDSINATLTYPDGTASAYTAKETLRLQRAIERIDDQYEQAMIEKHGEDYPKKDLVKLIQFGVGDVSVTGHLQPGMSPGGSHTGTIGVQLVETNDREWSSDKVIKMWREEAGKFPGTESAVFGTEGFGPGGAPIEFRLLGQPEDMAEIEAAIEKCKEKVATYPGVSDVRDNSQPGKFEFQLTVKDRAKALGITVADLAETVRSSYYGEEVMRLQRGRHEVKLMVRYPRDERRSLAHFEDIRVRVNPPTMQLVQQAVAQATGTGISTGLVSMPAELPLTDLAEVEVKRGYSEINRLDQLRAITITADVDESVGNAREIITDLKTNFIDQVLAEHPGVQVRWEGQAEQTRESVSGLIQGLCIALVVMFALLTLEFRSYLQPLLIMMIIPFGGIGALVGHAVMGIPVTIFSLFGLVALTGVVVNDSIVLIDFINHRVRAGIPLVEALTDAGQRRFRPVLLTSMTTIAGLLPILSETSLQAQVLIPMAVSMAFGLLFSTILVLVLVPTFYMYYAMFVGAGKDEWEDDAVPLDLIDRSEPPADVQRKETEIDGMKSVVTEQTPVDAQLAEKPLEVGDRGALP